MRLVHFSHLLTKKRIAFNPDLVTVIEEDKDGTTNIYTAGDGVNSSPVVEPYDEVVVKLISEPELL